MVPTTLILKSSDPYANEDQAWENFVVLKKEVEPTLEEGNQYLSAEIMFLW